MNSKPNIVFFFTDDQRFDTLHALGNAAIRTPNLDRLVHSGTTFTHAHIPGGTSGAVCMPSRAMLHSGRTLFHIEGAGQNIPADHATLGETLRGAGYRTFGTGKWHNGRAAYHRSFSDGDEIFFGGMNDHWNVPVYHYDPEGKYDAICPRCVDAWSSKETRNVQCDHINAGLHSSEMVCNAAIEFIQKQDDQVPFFTYISFLAPHDPRVMPQEFRDMYDPDEIELPPNFAGGHPFDTGALHIRDEMLAGFPRTPEETREHIADYYAMITHLDAELGRVIAALEQKGVWENTIIVFAGDNGLAVGQHGLFGKQSLYDHSVRVPLIFAGPGVPKGQKRDSFAYLLDIFPSLCELSKTPVPESGEGRSLVTAMHQDKPVRDELYLAYERSQRGVRDERHKLIEYVIDGKRNMTQLFDLKKDPWELHNLADDPKHANKLKEMRDKLVRLRDEWDDPETEWGQVFWSGWGDGGCGI